MKLERISELFCTSLGIGYTPLFPGTIASLIILPLVWFIKNEFGLSLFLLLIFFFFNSLVLLYKNINTK